MVGDIVVLKSGGPPMTVERVVSAERVVCVWFDKLKHFDRAFHSDTLDRVRRPGAQAFPEVIEAPR